MATLHLLLSFQVRQETELNILQKVRAVNSVVDEKQASIVEGSYEVGETFALCQSLLGELTYRTAASTQ